MLDVPPQASDSIDPAAAADEARTRRLFESSQTFLLRTPDPRVSRLRWITIALIALFFFVLAPLLTAKNVIDSYKLQLLGQYLCFAIAALGVDLIWGYTGLLTLCQALFFTLGGYCMGMFLSLPEGGGIYSYPQFMTFAYYGHGTTLPAFWVPFRHFWFAIAAGILIPGIAAGLFGFFILRSRVRGVYFSIITQALAYATWLLISRNEMLVGGTNGLTNFYRPLTQAREWIIGLYLLTVVVLVLAYLLCRVIVKSRLGRVLIAVRDKETRLYFAGYKPYAFKVFAFSVGAMIAAVGGMLYCPQMTVINPQNMDVQASIYIVVMVALGGRGRLWGAVFGALVMGVAKSAFTTDFSGAWLLMLGVIAVIAVLFFPDGFAGLWVDMEKQLAAGQNVLRACITALPLFVVSIAVGIEALGLTPQALRFDSAHPDRIAPKYWLLLAAFAIIAIVSWFNRKSPGKSLEVEAQTSVAEPGPTAETSAAKGGA